MDGLEQISPRPEGSRAMRPSMPVNLESAYMRCGERLAIRLRKHFGSVILGKQLSKLTPHEITDLTSRLAEDGEYKEIFADVYEQFKRTAKARFSEAEAVAKITLYGERAMIKSMLTASGFETGWMRGVREVLRGRLDELKGYVAAVEVEGKPKYDPAKKAFVLDTKGAAAKEKRAGGKGKKTASPVLKKKIAAYESLLNNPGKLNKLVREAIEKSGSMREFFERLLSPLGESGHVGSLDPDARRQMRIGERFNALDHGIDKLTSSNPVFKPHTGEAVLRMKFFPDEVLAGYGKAIELRESLASGVVHDIITRAGGATKVLKLSAAARAGTAELIAVSAKKGGRAIPLAKPIPPEMRIFRTENPLETLRKKAWETRGKGFKVGMIALAALSMAYVLGALERSGTSAQTVPKKVR